MRKGTDKIDIHQQVTLSSYQCDVAIAIWKRYGVFDTESNIAKQIRYKFSEDKIWAKTFYNYDEKIERDYNKLKRLTTQIINRYKDTIDFSGVDRIDYRSNGESWCVICKPEKNFARRQYTKRVGSAATNIVKADKTNEAFELGNRMVRDFMQRVEAKIPDHFERRRFLEQFKISVAENIKETENMMLLANTTSDDFRTLPLPITEEYEKGSRIYDDIEEESNKKIYDLKNKNTDKDEALFDDFDKDLEDDFDKIKNIIRDKDELF